MSFDLYHISENGNIKIFEPRLVVEESYNLQKEKVVWAIHEDKIINYIFPRDCPRIIYYSDEFTNNTDKTELFTKSTISRVVIVESHWIEKLATSTIYKYVFDSDNFELIDSIAGYYISKITVIPKDVVEIRNPLLELLKNSIELRIMDKISDLSDRIKNSTVKYSMIRLRNSRK